MLAKQVPNRFYLRLLPLAVAGLLYSFEWRLTVTMA